MASASYRNPQPKLTLEVHSEQTRGSLTPGQVARTLFELIDLGFVEPVKDEFGVVRYMPTNGRTA